MPPLHVHTPSPNIRPKARDACVAGAGFAARCQQTAAQHHETTHNGNGVTGYDENDGNGAMDDNVDNDGNGVMGDNDDNDGDSATGDYVNDDGDDVMGDGATEDVRCNGQQRQQR